MNSSKAKKSLLAMMPEGFELVSWAEFEIHDTHTSFKKKYPKSAKYVGAAYNKKTKELILWAKDWGMDWVQFLLPKGWHGDTLAHLIINGER